MIVTNNNSTKKCLAINEVSILRQSRQAANLSIKNNSKYIIKKISFRWCFNFYTSRKHSL